MTAMAGCLLVAVVVQQQSIIALRTEEPAPIAKTVQPVEDAPAVDAPAVEEPSRRAFVDDFQRDDFERRRFDFSEQRLLALVDSGTLTARSFYMIDDPWTTAAAKPVPAGDWPKQTYEPQSSPLPYYKLLKQLQEAGI